MTLENITGNLLQAYNQSVPGQNLCVDQLMTARRTYHSLRKKSYYTADGMVYSVDNGTPTVRITREAVNPVLNNIDDAFTQLTKNHNYQVSQADFDAVKSALDTITIDLTKLTLQSNEKEGCYLTISTTNYNTLNTEKRKVVERIYGQGTDFIKNMRMLKDAGITETRVCFLNPTYVTNQTKDSPIARASWLYGFYNSSVFGADDRNLDNNCRFRGVRKKTDNDQFSAQKSDSSSDFLRREGVVPEASPQGSHERSYLRDAPKKERVPPVAQAPAEVKVPTIDDILQYASPYLTPVNRAEFEAGLRNLYNQ